MSSQLNERLKREGIKTHKERVEELNRYLSNLSEHHDMYVSSFFRSSLPPSTFTFVFLLRFGLLSVMFPRISLNMRFIEDLRGYWFCYQIITKDPPSLLKKWQMLTSVLFNFNA